MDSSRFGEFMFKKVLVLLMPVLLLISCDMLLKSVSSQKRTWSIIKSEKRLFSPALAKLPSGALVCVFCQQDEGSDRQTIFLSQSTKNVLGWSAPDTVASTQFLPENPAVAALIDGSLMVSFVGRRKVSADGQNESTIGVFTTRSFDEGQTWSAPRMILLEEYDWLTTSSGVVELADGTLLIAMIARKEGEVPLVILASSQNNGRDWQQSAVVAQDTTHKMAFQNPALVALDESRLICLLDGVPGSHQMYLCRSADAGKTWTPPVPLNIQGVRPQGCFTPESILICAYQDFSPAGVSRSVSYDLGLTFENEKIIEPGVSPVTDISLCVVNRTDVAYGYVVEKDGLFEIVGGMLPDYRPEQPTGLNISVGKDASMTVRWNEVKNAHYYKLYRQEVDAANPADPDSSESQFMAALTATTFLDTFIDPAKSYRYKIEVVASSSELIENSAAVSRPVYSQVVSAEAGRH